MPFAFAKDFSTIPRPHSTVLVKSNMATYKGDPKDQDVTGFGKGMTGARLCGGITVTVNKSDLFTKRNGHPCHCKNCRTASGCVASNNMVVERGEVDIKDPKGLAKTYVMFLH